MTDNTPLNADDELNLSHLKDFRAVLKWSYDHGLLKGEYPDADSSGKAFILDQGEKRLVQLIQADRKKHELQARIDELTLLADFQMGDITVMGRNERSWSDRISELEKELEKL